MEGNNIYQSSKALDIEAHPTELAIIIKYGIKREQKIIYLKDLTPSIDSHVITRFVLDKCSIIPAHRAADVEQIIHYLQKRSTGINTEYNSIVKTTTNLSTIKASLDDIDAYIEMLYEDSEKTKGTAYILALSNVYKNLQYIIENDVLMSALTRVFREDSKKNFELATNISVIFLKLSEFKQFQSIISHNKIGTLIMQMIENELKRHEIWKNELKNCINDKSKKKWEYAIYRQDELLSILLQILINLSNDIKTEMKMIRRNILIILLRCLDHLNNNLLITTIKFLFKLSIYVENKEFMSNNNIIDKLIKIFPINNSSELQNYVFSLLFNLSFDIKLKNKMVTSGLLPFIANSIENNYTCLCLLYQLSTIDDAKAMITFTDTIIILMKMINNDNLVVKGLLINISLEKRNAQLICSTDGKGLNLLIELSINNKDIMLMKICRNIAMHDGLTQEFFIKHLRNLINMIIHNDNYNDIFIIECLSTISQITTTEWIKIINEFNLITWIENILNMIINNNKSKPTIIVPDDYLLQIIILIGTIVQDLNLAITIIPIVSLLCKIIEIKQYDDEIILQIIYSFYCLLTHQNVNQQLCTNNNFVEILIKLMHDTNQQIKTMCDQSLQFISESNDYWKKRIIEERFKFHNSQWLEMVKDNTDLIDDDDDESNDEMNNLILGPDELLNEEHEL